MGRDKADVPVAGVTMLDRVAESMADAVGRIILLGPDRDGWECWPDSVHAVGPLAGLATCLSRVESGRVLLVAVDHPFVRPQTLRHLTAIETGYPVVPVDEAGVRQVTCALYPAAIAGEALEEAANGGSVQTLLDRVSFQPVTPSDWRPWGEDGRSWFSVDSEAALAEGVGAFSSNDHGA